MFSDWSPPAPLGKPPISGFIRARIIAQRVGVNRNPHAVNGGILPIWRLFREKVRRDSDRELGVASLGGRRFRRRTGVPTYRHRCRLDSHLGVGGSVDSLAKLLRAYGIQHPADRRRAPRARPPFR